MRDSSMALGHVRSLANRVPIRVNGGPEVPEVKKLPRHKKNPEVGEKNTVYSNLILVEQKDAASFEDGEEVPSCKYHAACGLQVVFCRSLLWTGGML